MRPVTVSQQPTKGILGESDFLNVQQLRCIDVTLDLSEAVFALYKDSRRLADREQLVSISTNCTMRLWAGTDCGSKDGIIVPGK
jgi:hypothetical protein